jgi:hypothetical protein
MAITRSDLVTDVLQKIAVLPAGEIPSAEDDATVLKIINSRVEGLREHGIAWWSDDDIPLQIRDPLGDYIAGFCALHFDVGEDLSKYKMLQKEAEFEMRRLSANKAESSPTKAEYF